MRPAAGASPPQGSTATLEGDAAAPVIIPIMNAATCRICLSKEPPLPADEGDADASGESSGEDGGAPCTRKRPPPPGSQLVMLGCSCRGELAQVHRYCGARWFAQQRTCLCEICGEPAFNMPAGWDPCAPLRVATTCRAALSARRRPRRATATSRETAAAIIAHFFPPPTPTGKPPLPAAAVQPPVVPPARQHAARSSRHVQPRQAIEFDGAAILEEARHLSTCVRRERVQPTCSRPTRSRPGDGDAAARPRSGQPLLSAAAPRRNGPRVVVLVPLLRAALPG